MWKLSLLLFCFAIPVIAAEKMSAPQLIDLAKSHGAGLRDAITSSFDAKDLKEGTAWAGRGPDFFFATQAPSRPALMIDNAPGPQMKRLNGSDLWYATAHIAPVGRLHSFHYLVNGAKFGGKLDVPAFGALSYPQPGVPSGTLSEKIVHAIKAELKRSISQAYLSQIENGVRPHLTNATRMLLARFFKVHPGYLVDDPEGYHTGLVSDVRTIGAENYYPPLDL